MAGLKYEVEWNENDRSITLENSKNIIKIYVDLGTMRKTIKEKASTALYLLMGIMTIAPCHFLKMY